MTTKEPSHFRAGSVRITNISRKKRLPRPKKPEMEAHNVAFREALDHPMFDGYDKDIINAHLADFYCIFQLGVDWGRQHPEKKVVKG